MIYHVPPLTSTPQEALFEIWNWCVCSSLLTTNLISVDQPRKGSPQQAGDVAINRYERDSLFCTFQLLFCIINIRLKRFDAYQPYNCPHFKQAPFVDFLEIRLTLIRSTASFETSSAYI